MLYSGIEPSELDPEYVQKILSEIIKHVINDENPSNDLMDKYWSIKYLQRRIEYFDDSVITYPNEEINYRGVVEYCNVIAPIRSEYKKDMKNLIQQIPIIHDIARMIIEYCLNIENRR